MPPFWMEMLPWAKLATETSDVPAPPMVALPVPERLSIVAKPPVWLSWPELITFCAESEPPLLR